MEPATALPSVSFKQDPWSGQQEVFDALNRHPSYLNIQLPTGYGKTFTAAGCYAIKQRAGDVNRLLVVFPTDGQLEQFEADSHSDKSDLFLADIEGPRHVVDVRFNGADALRQHRTNRAQIFAITVQSLIQARGDDNVRALMESGRWMVVPDEYHHYGIDKAWGRSVRSLPAAFLLAMSATPTRPDDDSAFGLPHVTVSYRTAVEEQAVKPLRGHAYHYRIDAIDPTGATVSFTTTELAAEAGTSPDAIERWRIERKMRWSPKYISPLVSNPIERMLQTRLRVGHRLQVLVGAMCVSHAELICEQIRAMFPELAVDWVGTGQNGRPPEKNKEVRKQFCPEKNADGRREPTLDVLVHVGMCGEGLDTSLVTEVVHANSAHRNNSNDQENGRAARVLRDASRKVIAIEGNINFDATSEYLPFVGPAIMDAMDGLTEPRPPSPDDPPEPRPLADDEPILPELPAIVIYDMALDRIDSGDPGVQRMARVLVGRLNGFDIDDFHDASRPRHEAAVRDVLSVYRVMRHREAEEINEKSIVKQWQDQVAAALSTIAGHVIRRLRNARADITPSTAGDIKRRINARKKAALGEVTPVVEVYKRHYQWLRNFERDLLAADTLPRWLVS